MHWACRGDHQVTNPARFGPSYHGPTDLVLTIALLTMALPVRTWLYVLVAYMCISSILTMALAIALHLLRTCSCSRSPSCLGGCFMGRGQDEDEG